MKILIDIGHPGHVHYFKNTINYLKQDGHDIFITARDRKIIFELLDKLGFSYISRGKGKDSKLGKLSYMLKADFIILKTALKFKPDLFLSFSSPYAAQVAYLLGKKSIVLNDTEHTDKTHAIFTYPFSSTIITPFCYYNDLGSKQLKINSLIENLYLNSSTFVKDPNVKEQLGLEANQKYVIIRFVSWKAHHDYGQSGLSMKTKLEMINTLEEKFKIFISSEENLPPELEKYKIHIDVSKMHSVLSEASLFIGESATMASESCLLGTKAVYINSLPLMGYLQYEELNGMLKYFQKDEGVVDYIKSLLENDKFEVTGQEKSIMMQKNFIDPTKLLVWFLKNYPSSIDILKNQPDFQNQFQMR